MLRADGPAEGAGLSPFEFVVFWVGWHRMVLKTQKDKQPREEDRNFETRRI